MVAKQKSRKVDEDLDDRLQHFRDVLVNTPCAGEVVIDSRYQALLHANTACRSYNAQQLVMFTDGSQTHKYTGIGLVWLEEGPPKTWGHKAYTLWDNFSSSDAEIYGLYEAIVRGKDLCMLRFHTKVGDRGAKPSDKKLVIYTDNQGSLEDIRDFHQRKTRKQLEYKKMLHLANLKALVSDLVNPGIQVEMRWVPGHSKVEGNVLADQYAKIGALGYNAARILRGPPSGHFKQAVLDEFVAMETKLLKGASTKQTSKKSTKKGTQNVQKAVAGKKRKRDEFDDCTADVNSTSDENMPKRMRISAPEIWIAQHHPTAQRRQTAQSAQLQRKLGSSLSGTLFDPLVKSKMNARFLVGYDGGICLTDHRFVIRLSGVLLCSD